MDLGFNLVLGLIKAAPFFFFLLEMDNWLNFLKRMSFVNISLHWKFTKIPIWAANCMDQF